MIPSLYIMSMRVCAIARTATAVVHCEPTHCMHALAEYTLGGQRQRHKCGQSQETNGYSGQEGNPDRRQQRVARAAAGTTAWRNNASIHTSNATKPGNVGEPTGNQRRGNHGSATYGEARRRCGRGLEARRDTIAGKPVVQHEEPNARRNDEAPAGASATPGLGGHHRGWLPPGTRTKPRARRERRRGREAARSKGSPTGDATHGGARGGTRWTGKPAKRPPESKGGPRAHAAGGSGRRRPLGPPGAVRVTARSRGGPKADATQPNAKRGPVRRASANRQSSQTPPTTGGEHGSAADREAHSPQPARTLRNPLRAIKQCSLFH